MSSESTPASKILIVDDQNEVCSVLSWCLEREGMIPVVAHTGEAGLEKIRTEHPDAMLLDIQLPDSNGLEMLKQVKGHDEDLPVILITGYPEIRTAVAAMRAGAHDYLAKPLKNHEVLRVVFRALNERALRRKVRQLSSHVLEGASSLLEFMGPSDAIRRLAAEVDRVAKTNFSVLILGETGAGKELVAHAIHQLSSRSEGPIMAVDCGAIPEPLLESELFGHEKGAYTGADKQKIGRFEMAHGGTLFLDEISNMPWGSQAKLLRVLQEKTIYRIGGNQPTKTDVRVLAASNRDLNKSSEEGAFRRDVYFRLNEFSLVVPSLRERQEDILYLAKRFMDSTNLELQKTVHGFTQSAVDALLAYEWPGNVRQLRSMIRRAVLLADESISVQHLGIRAQPQGPKTPEADSESTVFDSSKGSLSLREVMECKKAAIEREILTQVLRETGGNKAKAARLLQIDYKTMHSKVKQYGISID